MIKENENALICDFAETYNIYDYKQLPLSRVAVLAYGLRDDSRIKRILRKEKAPIETILLVSIVDRLSLLLWAKTKDGQKNRNRPKSLMGSLFPQNADAGVVAFGSAEEFEERRKKLMEGS